MPAMRTSNFRRNVVAAITAAGLGTAALTGCSSSTSAPTPADTSSNSSSGSPSPKPSNSYPVEFSSTLTSSYSRIVELGTDPTKLYGLNTLDGKTTINESSVSVKMLGTVDYQQSSGPVGGFLELKWSDGTILAFRQSGQATYDASSKKTNYDLQLEVLGASAKANGTTGTGTLTGVRSGKTEATGGSTKIDVNLDLVNAPTSITGNAQSRGTPAPSQTYAATIAP